MRDTASVLPPFTGGIQDNWIWEHGQHACPEQDMSTPQKSPCTGICTGSGFPQGSPRILCQYTGCGHSRVRESFLRRTPTLSNSLYPLLCNLTTCVLQCCAIIGSLPYHTHTHIYGYNRKYIHLYIYNTSPQFRSFGESGVFSQRPCRQIPFNKL